MNLGRTVFSQITEHLPAYEFQKCVDRYRGDSHFRGFSCLDQYLAMAFAQLTYRESLRDIEACLRSVGGKLYHMGLRGKVSRTTLADANESHDWRIFADFAQILIGIARPLYLRDPIGVDLDQSLYGWDSTTIDLCLSLFPWARTGRGKMLGSRLYSLIGTKVSAGPRIGLCNLLRASSLACSITMMSSVRMRCTRLLSFSKSSLKPT